MSFDMPKLISTEYKNIRNRKNINLKCVENRKEKGKSDEKQIDESSVVVEKMTLRSTTKKLKVEGKLNRFKDPNINTNTGKYSNVPENTKNDENLMPSTSRRALDFYNDTSQNTKNDENIMPSISRQTLDIYNVTSYFNDIIFVELVNYLIMNYQVKRVSLRTRKRKSVSLRTVMLNPITNLRNADLQEFRNALFDAPLPFPEFSIFQGISRKFPEAGNANELKENYKQLVKCERDNVNEHGVQVVDVEEDNNADMNLSNLAPPSCLEFANGCGQFCFKRLEQSKKKHTIVSRRATFGGKKTFSRQLRNLSNATRSNDIMNNSGVWTDTDIALFKKLQAIYFNNYCVISFKMKGKTCQEVYEFAKKSNSNFSAQNQEHFSESAGRNMAEKRVWSAHCRKVQQKRDTNPNAIRKYTPCTHRGACNNQCPCIMANNFCEKFCKCYKKCRNRFPGCDCKTECNTKECVCFMSLRECDPDLCLTCGAKEFVKSMITCKNISVQRKFEKSSFISRSGIFGCGIFLKNGAQKDEFISEYCGEIISQDEADRRRKEYDNYMHSFLFNLNSDFVVDATRKGNKIRYANHSMNPNCYAKVIMVNGDNRIGIYAKCTIAPKEELFFDYSYGSSERVKFMNTE